MDPTAFLNLLKEAGPYGVPAIMAVLFYAIIRMQAKGNAQSLQAQKEAYGSAITQHQEVLRQYKTDLANLSAQHLQAAREMRQMYDNNMAWVEKVVALTERYDKRTEYQEKLIEATIQTMQQCTDVVDKCRKKAGN